ncbi:peptide chain release factor 1, mitochondrial-like [Thalassophryne amazonica]|uniref:peptide chain release factor 1, mitochondrial-like n=1 Tax=Thalassophryne amazonica TaxID=390379 RepID=UPI0014718E79|nr:peptide chain release factor 1, mitochondrial-like [Thalassophryne amazonica]
MLELAQTWEELQHCGAAATKRFCHTDLQICTRIESVQRYLQQLMEEYGEVSKKLQYAHLSDSERKLLMKKRTKLLPLANVFHKSEQALKDLQEVSSGLDGSSGATEEDAHLTELLKEEEAQISHKILTLRRDLIKALVPTDPLDSSNIVLEVVSGRTTGGKCYIPFF